MFALLLATALAAVPTAGDHASAAVPPAGAQPIAPAPPAGEIDRAIAMGRFDQARLMIAAQVRASAPGAATERSLALLAFGEGRDEEALARAAALLRATPDDALLLEQATIAALHLGRADDAAHFGGRATRLPNPSWRVWNAMGVVADSAEDWDAADRAYARAATLAPGRFEVVNNHGWSLLLRGDWQGARDAFAAATALAPRSARAANNLDFAELGLAADLPVRGAGESSSAYAARLNDAGIAARLRGEPVRARAAFARAIEASGEWFARAGANLAAVEAPR